MSRARRGRSRCGSYLLPDGLYDALRGAADQTGVAAQHDEAVAPRDHRARVVRRKRDAAEDHVLVGEDLRLGPSHDFAHARMIELTRETEALRQIAARHCDDVESA